MYKSQIQKSLVLLLLLALPLGSVFAQSSSRFVVKLSDGTSYDLNRAAASIREDRSLEIFADTKGSISHIFQIKIKPAPDGNNIMKGNYLFNSTQRLLDYVPGEPSGNYQTEASYAQMKNENTVEEWISKYNPDFGYIEIESITADRVKGKFYCEVEQKLPLKGAKKIMEGTFDLAIIKAGTSSQNTGQTSNPGKPTVSPAAKEQEGSPSKHSEREPLLGFYDVQFALSAITTSDMGIDVDFGTTLVNFPYDKNNDVRATIELHYDYARQKFPTMQTRRNHLYARLRPFTEKPNTENSAENILAMFISGIYADLGYTKGYYFNINNNGERQAPDYNADGIFWGIGWNLIWRNENGWGVNAGFGSKRYTIELPNGTENKYRSRLITLGVVRNLLWKN